MKRDTVNLRVVLPVTLLILTVTVLLSASVLLVTKRVSEEHEAFIMRQHAESVRRVFQSAVADLVHAGLTGEEEVEGAMRKAALEEVVAYWKANRLEGAAEGADGAFLAATPGYSALSPLVPRGAGEGLFHRYRGLAFVGGAVTEFPAWEWRVVTVAPPINLVAYNTEVFLLVPVVLLSGALLLLGARLFLRHNLAEPVRRTVDEISRGVPVSRTGLQELDRLGEAVNAAVAALTRRNEELQQIAEQRRRAEEAVHASLTEKEVLLKEIHHRVKNNLQVVSGLINLQAAHIGDPAVREVYRESENRIITMALIHERLYESKDLAQVEFSSYLRHLTENLRVSYGMDRRGVRLDLVAASVTLPVDTAIPCALVANELVSNAMKHAFPGGRTGTVRVGFFTSADRGYLLTVSDDGVGYPEGQDFRQARSMGMQLVNILTQQLGGGLELDREHGGTRWKATFREYREAGTVLY